MTWKVKCPSENSMDLKQGMITWANLVLPNGKPKRRPVVLVPDTNMLATLGMIRVVGISTSFRPGDPNVIPLAWRADGNIYTGLKEPCAISLALQDDIERDRLEATKYWVGKAALIEMLEKLFPKP